MTKREALTFRSAPAGAQPVWRSLEEKSASPEERAKQIAVESGVQVDGLVTLGTGLGKKALGKKSSKDGVGRRTFLAASTATAAIGLSGCIRRPAEEILPYTVTPEYALPGIALHYASALSHNGESVGVVVEQHEGRPTKIEGNALHSASNPGGTGAWGGTGVHAQASILDLYDQDRGAVVRHGEETPTWGDFDEMLGERMTAATGSGASVRILSEPLTSPTQLRLKAAILSRYPGIRFHTWTAVSDDNAREGARIAFGRRARAVVDYARPRVIVSIDCDFLGTEPGSTRSARLFGAGRRMTSSTDSMSRLYAVESTLSLTGSNADHRLRLRSTDIEGYLRALGRTLVSQGAALGGIGGALTGEGPAVSAQWLEAVARDLLSNRGRAVIVVGSRQPARVHALAHAINESLGAHDAIVQFHEAPDASETEMLGELRALVTDMQGGDVSTLLMLGGNPVLDAPVDLDFAGALAGVETSIHLASHEDETSAASSWHLPMAHELESWGDHRSMDGTLALQQPLIAPLRSGRSATDLLGLLAIGTSGNWRSYHQVRQTFVDLVGDLNFERAWRQALHRGVIGVTTPSRIELAFGVQSAEVARAISSAEPMASEGWEVIFVPDLKIWDGRHLNNPWLLELPDPLTKLVWDNAALLSPNDARELGVRNGDHLRISKGDRSIEIPAFILPGHGEHAITLPLGWGRELGGSVGAGNGTNVYPLRSSEGLGFESGFEVAASGGHTNLVVTQEHHTMDTDNWTPFGDFDQPERPAAIVATLEEYQATPDFTQAREPDLSVGPLWEQVDYATPHPPAIGGESYSLVREGRVAPEGAPLRHAWGMVIDLTTCFGCNACVVACNAENNVPTVGRDQVQRGREMHWLRIDRYYIGEDTGNPIVAFQPVGCQHCEEAPCENVCPVNATEHSPEGLNEMAYNRCIGTRYCMNNCPYKVRRFNFLAYQADPTELQRMQFNPNVSVRMRGVMEKCSYCIQRVQAAKIAARNDGNRALRDGDVVPACAQACPSEAIVFGDYNDETSRVSRAAAVDRHYSLLGNVGTQPRTRYLGRVRNTNSEMA
jgi:molybdopterin-containing oxidoreductase family iron-sulfur binding subunit